MTLIEGGATRRPNHVVPNGEGPRTRRGLVLAARGDALSPYLFSALARRYPITGRMDPELNRAQRLAVAAGSFRPSRRRWVEQFYKSHHGYRLRTANAARQHRRLARTSDPVFQVHTLFEVPAAASVLYVDCTHAQSAAQWPDWNPLQGNALTRWYRREAAAYQGAVHIFAFSEQTRHSLEHDYAVPVDRISVVAAGVNLDPLPAAPRATPSRPTVLFLGNDFVRKGGPVLVQAFRQVRRQLPTARLLLAGTDPKIAPEPGVHVLGRVDDRTRVRELYRQASVFCLPSHFDPMPLVLLEAMAYGIPVVTTASCGIPDVITNGRTGTLVEPGAPDAVAETLLRLLTDPDRATELGAAGRSRVASEFTWDQVVDRMSPVLDRLMER